MYTGLLRDRRLVAECAERFEIPLDRHQIEAATVFRERLRRGVAGASELQKRANQLVDALLRQIDIRVTEQRREIVGVRAHSRVLKIDDVQPAIVQHQIAAVVVAVTKHARLAGQLVGDDQRFFA